MVCKTESGLRRTGQQQFTLACVDVTRAGDAHDVPWHAGEEGLARLKASV